MAVSLLAFQIISFYSCLCYSLSDQTLQQRNPDLCTCKNVETPRERVFNGREVNPSDLTFVGSLYHKFLNNSLRKEKDFDEFDYDYRSFCTCSLLNSEWLLTAAHCLDKVEKKTKEISKKYFNRTDFPYYDRRVAVSGFHRLQFMYRFSQYNSRFNEYHLHPQFDPGPLRAGVIDYDLALVRSEKKFELGSFKNIYPVCLDRLEFKDILNKSAIIAGFGRTDHKFGPDNLFLSQFKRYEIKLGTHILLMGKTKFNSLSKIGKTYLREKHSNLFALHDESNICSGDSGGAVLVLFQNRLIQMGVLSAGPRYCQKQNYTVISPVYDQMGFIRKYTGNNICLPYAERTHSPTVYTQRLRALENSVSFKNSKSDYLFIILLCTLLIIFGIMIWSAKKKKIRH